jgi:hypothetical protein
MVQDAIPLPMEAAEQVAQEQGEVSTEGVRETFDEPELDRLQREAVKGSRDMVVVAVLEPTEEERVEEAAARAGTRPARWLARRTVEEVDAEDVSGSSEVLARQVENIIFRRTEA